jgi:hypothetical protein
VNKEDNMDSLCIHNVKAIRMGKVESSVEPFHWRNIIITNNEGRDFEVTLFGKPADLEIMEVEK